MPKYQKPKSEPGASDSPDVDLAAEAGSGSDVLTKIDSSVTVVAGKLPKKIDNLASD